MKANIQSHVHLELGFETKSELSAVMKSIIPDNIDCPNGLVVTMSDKDNRLILDISCTREIYVIISTVDEILSHIIMAKQVVANARS